MNNDKVYFLPGDMVTLRQEIQYKPTMYVIKKVTKSIRVGSKTNRMDLFQGILCRWFTLAGELQEAIFNTKDLIKL